MNKQQQKDENRKTVSVVENVDRIKYKPLMMLYKSIPHFPLWSTAVPFPDLKSQSKPHVPPLQNSPAGQLLPKKGSYFTEIACPSGLIF